MVKAQEWWVGIPIPHNAAIGTGTFVNEGPTNQNHIIFHCPRVSSSPWVNDETKVSLDQVFTPTSVGANKPKRRSHEDGGGHIGDVQVLRGALLVSEIRWATKKITAFTFHWILVVEWGSLIMVFTIHIAVLYNPLIYPKTTRIFFLLLRWDQMIRWDQISHRVIWKMKLDQPCHFEDSEVL